MNPGELIGKLDAAWDCDGFLGGIRRGQFNPDAGAAFLGLLESIVIGDDELVPKRLLAQLWYLPSFLEWQKHRVAEFNGKTEAYDRFVTEVYNVLERVLGVP
jgi:hypothetical protein